MNNSSGFEVFQAYEEDTHKRLINLIHESRPETTKKEKKIRPRSRKRKNIIPRRTILNRTKPKLISIFQHMCGMPNSSIKSCRLTNFLFKQYLQKKFPNEMAEAMAKHFDFKSANFEDFCVEMDRFICATDDKHFALCFDAFDINKDKYICYQDTYIAISMRKDNLYDSDLVKIKKMFEMKIRGMVPQKRESRKGRRMSIMSVSSDISAYEEEIKEKKTPHVHPDKPEAITLEDFQKIEFNQKPQLLINFFIHVCYFDIEKFKEVTTPKSKSRKQSQDVIIEMSQNGNNIIELDDPKINYYNELEAAMSLFPFEETKDLLDKFEILRDKHSPDFKTISKLSMIEN